MPLITKSAALSHPKCLSIISPDRITDPGFTFIVWVQHSKPKPPIKPALTLSRFAYLGAVPCVASKMACPLE